MCYYVQLNLDKEQLENHFEADYRGAGFEASEQVNGFAHPQMPIVLNTRPQIILSGEWGLIPEWAMDREIQAKTLNARIETLSEKNSFKEYIQNRCLVPVNAFYEWKWLDSKGKQKEQYRIKIPHQEISCLGGLYNIYSDEKTGQEISTFTIVTTAANELMSEIHNIKKRMPIVLNKESEYQWLNAEDIRDFAFPQYNPKLEAEIINGPAQTQLSLF